jgi:hypothetical protein
MLSKILAAADTTEPKLPGRELHWPVRNRRQVKLYPRSLGFLFGTALSGAVFMFRQKWLLLETWKMGMPGK